jgi:predicted O-linked N-acetylglucosamine transferase (SPINDLY family)
MAADEPQAARPETAAEFNRLAIASYRAGDLDAAVLAWRRALEITPDLAEVAGNLGVALTDLRRYAEAEAAHRRSIALNPAAPDAWYNLGRTLHAAGTKADAVGAYEQALVLDPRHSGALYNLGLLLKELDRLAESIQRHRSVLEIEPRHALAREQLLFELRQACEWRDLQAIERAAQADADRALAEGRPAASPFLLITRSSESALHLRNARLWSAQRLRHTAPMPPVRRPPRPDGRITVGYLSADFHDHATAHLLGRLFALHDRTRVRVHAYSYGPDDGSMWRRRIVAACDAFVHLEDVDDAEAARRIRADEVDILVDLKGWTEHSRLGICARRPAPVQATYLGFPGTTGAACFDYAIVDSVVAPPGDEAFFSEQLVRLPHAYQVNGSPLPAAAPGLTRAEAGLPETGFVFASFNQPYKIEPALFDAWMRILAHARGSVLWILAANDLSAANLRREAAARGVSPARLIFARRWPKDRHLARLPLADAVLDTRICCGHTSTSDALSVGVPVIGFCGEHFASRVSASCLTAIGAQELITPDLAAYEALALRLARDPPALAALKAKLAANRMTQPLFDTPRFARDLERAYAEMWRLYQAGEAPRPITWPLM